MFFYGKGKTRPIICVASKCAKYKQQNSRIRPGVKSRAWEILMCYVLQNTGRRRTI